VSHNNVERFEVSADRLLQDWRSAGARAAAYLRRLGVEAGESVCLARSAVRRAATQPGNHDDAMAAVFAAVREILAERQNGAGAQPQAADGSDELRWRLDVLEDFQSEQNGQRPLRWGARVLRSMPPLKRRSMQPNRFLRLGLRRRIVGSAQAPGPGPRQQRPWVRIAFRRRVVLGLLILVPSVIATGFMLDVLPHQGRTPLEVAIALFFGALFGWISIGFWTALMGFLVLTGRRDRFAITSGEETDDAVIADETRTAILMPICEEPVDRVFAGMKAIYRSLERLGALAHFDFFILSDSADPARWLEEEMAWLEWAREVGFERVFYRHRRTRIERKSGNIADFCRRWGSQYRYRVTLDADSVMAGEAVDRLVRLMERHPRVGMIQTVPVSMGRRSLFARVQQFAGGVYGPMFAAGLHYWQLGEGQYWGHNTIIRVAPFMDHCALPRLPGEPPLGGEILSHDFVEAALMGRAGWELWLAFDMEGSYEEAPSSLLEEMRRDRRWCQGNLQHLRLLFVKGLQGAHRALFLNGVLSYVSALLWFCFLTLSTAEAVWEAVREPEYFPAGRSLFPEWPVWRPGWAIALLAVTGTILFLPKILSIALILVRGRRRDYGGFIRLLTSVLLEFLLSALFAPIRMVFHARFVFSNLLGRTVSWRSQTREDSETTWGEALRYHGVDTLWATAWALGVHSLNPQYFWWLTPIVSALILSVPLSVITSRVSLGDWAHRLGLFLLPQDTSPPEVLLDLKRELRRRVSGIAPSRGSTDAVAGAIIDPRMNALHVGLEGLRSGSGPALRAARRDLVTKVLETGPEGLSTAQRRRLLMDGLVLQELHRRVWEQEAAAAPRWPPPELLLQSG